MIPKFDWYRCWSCKINTCSLKMFLALTTQLLHNLAFWNGLSVIDIGIPFKVQRWIKSIFQRMLGGFLQQGPVTTVLNQALMWGSWIFKSLYSRMLVSFRFLARIRGFYILAGFFWPSYPSGTPDGLVCLQAMEFPGLFTVVACGYQDGPTGGISPHAGHAQCPYRLTVLM